MTSIEKRLRRGKFTIANHIASPNKPLPHARSRSIVSLCSSIVLSLGSGHSIVIPLVKSELDLLLEF